MLFVVVLRILYYPWLFEDLISVIKNILNYTVCYVMVFRMSALVDDCYMFDAMVILIGDICIVYIMLVMIIISIWVGVYFPSYFLSITYLFLPNRCRRDVTLREVGTTTMKCQPTCNSYSKDRPS